MLITTLPTLPLALAPPPSSLVPLAYKPLRLGTVSASGWLLGQLKQQAASLSGHLDLFWNDVNDSVWIGGAHDHSGAGHERGPYWLNGVVPLSAILNASGTTLKQPDLTAQVEHWVRYILDNRNKTTGWLGPDDGLGGKGNTYWSAWNVLASLLQYADAHAGEPIAAACYEALLGHVAEATKRQRATPFASWSQNRWQDWVLLLHMLLDAAPPGHEAMLLDAAQLTYEQRWDWAKYYRLEAPGGFPHTLPNISVPSWTMYDHGVNNAMGTKWAAVWYRQSADAKLKSYTRKILDAQEASHGQPHGVFSADECFGGRELNRGLELCTVVEQLYSLQVAFRATGELALLDDIERIAFNALPATLSADMWQHQYLQQVNELSACPTNPHVWQSDGPDSTLFGVAPNFGCCTANFNQGWPKLAASALVTKPDDGGLVLALLLPVAATLPTGATVHVDTSYPNGDDVTVTLSVPKSGGKDTPLYVHVPGWADTATYTVVARTTPAPDAAGVEQAMGEAPPPPHKVVVAGAPAPNGTLVRTVCQAGHRITLTLHLNPRLRVEAGWGGHAGRRTNPARGMSAGGFSAWPGQVMPKGGDVHVANMSMGEAEKWCNASEAVDEAERRRQRRQGPPPSSPASTVYFKGAWNPEPNGHWVAYSKAWDVHRTNAVAVLRGPLLFALRLQQRVSTVRTWPPFGNTDVNITTPSVWKYALVLDETDPTKSLAFERLHAGGAGVAFNSSAPALVVHAKAVEIGAWRAALDAADEPPPSPMKRPAGGAVESVELVPYGSTELRMGALPWMVA